MGRGVNIPWVEGSIYVGVSKYHGKGDQYDIATLLNSLFKIRGGLIFCGNWSQYTMGIEINLSGFCHNLNLFCTSNSQSMLRYLRRNSIYKKVT